jgi:hypothetical protein
MASLALVSAMPQNDLPETTYNEVDTPINQAAPTLSGTRFVRPPAKAVILPKHISEVGRHVSPQATVERRSVDPLYPRDPHSLQDLLCVFLI